MLAAFQHFINNLLRQFLDIFRSAYIDDILVYSDGYLNNHFDKLEKVLEEFNSASLRLDLDKCSFGVKKLNILGSSLKQTMT